MQSTRVVIETIQIKFEVRDERGQAGRASIVLVSNELHPVPYALLEDVFVREDVRGSGVSTELVRSCIKEASSRGCYKLILCHTPGILTAWYARKFGFKLSGNMEMRLDLPG
ncbi:MAG: GNAT family N-acetyltransferase [Patescibacteria group bacterium]